MSSDLEKLISAVKSLRIVPTGATPVIRVEGSVPDFQHKLLALHQAAQQAESSQSERSGDDGLAGAHKDGLKALLRWVMLQGLDPDEAMSAYREGQVTKGKKTSKYVPVPSVAPKALRHRGTTPTFSVGSGLSGRASDTPANNLRQMDLTYSRIRDLMPDQNQ